MLSRRFDRAHQWTSGVRITVMAVCILGEHIGEMVYNLVEEGEMV